MKNKILILFLGLLLFLPMFFALPKNAEAACNYSIVRFDANGNTTASVSDTINFTAEMDRKGSFDSSCVNEVKFELYLKDNTSFLGGFKDQFIESKNATFRTISGRSGSLATVNFSVPVSKIDRSALQNKSILDFYVKGVKTGIIGIDPLVSNIWTVNISGSNTGSFSVKLNPLKSKFDGNEMVSLDIFVNSFNLQIDPQFQKIYLVVKSQNKKIIDYTVNRSDIYNKTFTTNNFKINKENGFNEGGNILVVELFQAGTEIKIGSATASIQVTGLDSKTPDSTPPAGGGADLGKACTQNSDCASQYCSDKICTTNPNSNPDFATCVKNKGGIAFCCENEKQFTCANVCDGYFRGNTKASRNCSGSESTANPQDSCTGDNPDPRYCLVPIVPETGLLTMFLLIAKGFLGMLAAWAILFIIVGGVRMVLAQGNEEAYGQAKRTITFAILGMIIAAMSFSIVNIVQNILRVDIEKTSKTLQEK